MRSRPVAAAVTVFIGLLPALLSRGENRSAPLIVRVPGWANPWLAGMSPGTTTISGDRAPDQSPVAIAIRSGRVGTLTITATGGVQHHPFDPPRFGMPDGGLAITHGAENGLSQLVAPVNALVGVFLDNARPDKSSVPQAMDFSRIGWHFTTLTPQLKQVFFIGSGTTLVRDARSSPRTRVARRFVVPKGATRLFLGTMDEYQWNNNGGWLTVSVQTDSAETESDIFVVDSTITYPE